MTKRYPKQNQKNEMAEEIWNVKLAISFIIQLANDLNIKYMNRDR